MNSLELWMLFTWLDLAQIIFFGLLLVLIYRRGVKDGVLKEQERRVLDWVKREFRKHHDE